MSILRPASRRWLYQGTVYHARTEPKPNSFRYPSVFLCFPLSKTQELSSRLFGVNRPSLFAFYDRDHGDGGNPLAWIRHVLQDQGVTGADGEVWLLTMPRILGFVFNPVSFWYCHDSDGLLRAVLCEVNNTFGERHCYLLTACAHAAISDDTPLSCAKVFHVSPFYPIDGTYYFRFNNRDDRRSVHIDYHRANKLTLRTCVSGTAITLTDALLLKTFLQLGWATLWVVLRIHWQALRLWIRGVPFHRKPVSSPRSISS